MPRKLTPDERALRKELIITAAVTVALRDGYMGIRRASVATEVGCSNALVSQYFGTMTQLRRDVMRQAIRERILPIVAQGLAVGCKHARKADDVLKNQARAWL